MIKPLKALGALVVLAALIGGIPLALLTFYGNPIPQQLPGAEDVAHLFTTNDSIGFLLFVVVWIGWIAWATAYLHPRVCRALATISMPHPRVMRRALLSNLPGGAHPVPPG